MAEKCLVEEVTTFPREDGILVDSLKKQPQQGQNKTQ